MTTSDQIVLLHTAQRLEGNGIRTVRRMLQYMSAGDWPAARNIEQESRDELTQYPITDALLQAILKEQGV